MVWSTQFQEKFHSLVSQPMARFIHSSSSANVQRTTSILQDAKKGSEVTPSTTQASASPTGNRMPGGPKTVPTFLDRKFLVWSGQFKSADEIPRLLDADHIYRARSYGRIRMNIFFLFLAAAGGGLMVVLGKRAAGRGESLEQQNLEWHRKIKEDYESEKRNKK